MDVFDLPTFYDLLKERIGSFNYSIDGLLNELKKNNLINELVFTHFN